MKYFIIFVITILLTYGEVSIVRGDCGDAAAKHSEDGQMLTWFKNLGCQIKKGAEDLNESAKPWTDKIVTGAKDFGHTVAQKYDEVKHKLTSDDKPVMEQHSATGVHSGSTEKVLLAPLPDVNRPALAPLPHDDTSSLTHSTVAHGSHDSTTTTTTTTAAASKESKN